MIQHEIFCMARPGEDAPRVETFTTTLDAGRIVSTERCQECGAAAYLELGRI